MRNFYKIALVAVLATISTACSKKSSDSSGTSSITFAGKIGGLRKAIDYNLIPSPVVIDDEGQVGVFATTDYKLYCVTFTSSPTAATSTFGTDGSFSVSLPANTPFGCFVNSVTTNLPVATVVVAGSGTGMSNTSTASMNLASNVDVGTVTLDLAKNKVEIPAASLASAAGSNTTSLNLADIDNYGWTMTCVTTGVTEIDSACATFVGSGNTVYLRVLSGTEGGTTIYGIGAWASYSEFQNCGSIDINTATKTSIESGGFAFTASGAYAPATAANFSNWGTTCGLRSANGDSSYNTMSANTADAHWDLQNMYCLAPMQKTGTGYSFICDSSGTNGACTYSHTTSVTLTPGASASEMYGAFTSAEQRSAGCGGAVDTSSAFSIKFTRGSQQGT